MRKKKLVSIPAPELRARGNKKRAMEARAAYIDGETVLEVDLWGEKKPDGSREKICRHFVGSKKYLTLFESRQQFDINGTYRTYEPGQWSDMNITCITNGGLWRYSSFYVNETDYSKETQEIILAFTGNAGNLIWALEMYEEELKQEEYRNAMQRKQARINALMEAVRPVTQDAGFKSWLDQVVFPERYLFVETRKTDRGYRCYCSACGKMHYEKDQPRHNNNCICPRCGTEAVAKTRTGKMKKKKNVLVVQAVDGKRWALRHFEFWEECGTRKKITGRSTYGYQDFSGNEKARMFIGDAEMQGDTPIYWGQKMNEVDDRQDWWDARRFPQNIDSDFYLYPGGLQETCMQEALKRILEAGAQAGAELPYNTIIRWHRVNDYAYIEYLIKGKFYKLAYNLVKRYDYTGRGPADLLDMEADSLAGFLRLDGQRKNRLKQIDGGIYALRLLQEERAFGKVSQENLLYAERYKILPEELHVSQTGMSLNKMLNYIRRQSVRNKMSPKKILGYYKDYLIMAAERGADLRDPIICINKRMIEFHDAYIEEKNRAADERRAEELDKKYPEIRLRFNENMALFGWENKDYEMAVPHTARDILAEGRKQHHCVASSDHYIKEMNEGRSYILFLRRKENRDVPYYTLQVKISGRTVSILQWYAAYNRKPNKKAVKKALAEWKKEVRKKLDGAMQIPE